MLGRQVLRLGLHHFGRRAVEGDTLVIAKYGIAIDRQHFPATEHAERIRKRPALYHGDLVSGADRERPNVLITDRERKRPFLPELAADQGDMIAQGNLGDFYANGRGGLPKDESEAARLYKLAADQGNATAQTNLGFFYENGRGGLPKNDREAARLYKLAADQGNAFAQDALKQLAAP
jgi:Sel1 repeat